jgi:hypothetical protein
MVVVALSFWIGNLAVLREGAEATTGILQALRVPFSLILNAPF